MRARAYTIAVDFDGVIHSYRTPWESARIIPDPPVPGAVEWLNAMADRFTIVIHTTRGKTPEGQAAVREYLARHGVRDAASIEVTAVKPPALIYLDDRAVRFDGMNFPTATQIHREYVPWNKRERRAGP